MERTFSRPEGPLRGTIVVPGDKSISHRAVLFSAMAKGTSQLTGVLDSADVRSTIEAVRALGAKTDFRPGPGGSLQGTVTGWGVAGPQAPMSPIECGNSGTTARLLLGAVAGWPLVLEIIGDTSLSRRPMLRVTEPLAEKGARFATTESGTLPVTLRGSGSLSASAHTLGVASAQVKTAILLAGTRAKGRTLVTEPAPSRDHTERMLPAFGVEVGRDLATNTVWVDGPVIPRATSFSVPGDPSSAAFIVAAALLVPASSVRVENVSFNPTRLGFMDVLMRMGASLTPEPNDLESPEPSFHLHAEWTPGLRATTVTADEVPSLVDEIPVLALVASQADGTTRFEGVGELRVKESDRLEAVALGLRALGVQVRSGEDWLEVDGPAPLVGAKLSAQADHRLAMCWALAGLAAEGPVTVEGFESVEVSYPRFAEDLAELGA